MKQNHTISVAGFISKKEVETLNMFKPKTEKIEKIAEAFPESVEQLEKLFVGKTNIYIDDANVRPWSNKLGWHIDYKRLKQFLDSFDNIESIKIYRGTLIGDKASKESIEEIKRLHYDLKTKEVKIMRHSIDVSSLAKPNSPDLLEKFIRRCLLIKMNLETIESLNQILKDLNDMGIKFIEDRKCNFDVEIGINMLLDHERNKTETFVLWSGDSDFTYSVERLLNEGKNVVLFATVGRVSSELNALAKRNSDKSEEEELLNELFIFDIKKIRNFICWKKEIQERVRGILQ